MVSQKITEHSIELDIASIMDRNTVGQFEQILNAVDGVHEDMAQYSNLCVDEKGIRIESTEDLPSIGSLHIKGTEGYIKHLMEHIHDEVDDLKRNAKTLANAGVNVSKSEGKHKVIIEFAGRHLASIKPLKGHFINFVSSVYQVNETEDIQLLLEKNDAGGSKLSFKLWEIKNINHHHQFIEKLMNDIETRHIFMYFQDIIFANKNIDLFRKLDEQIKKVITETLNMEARESVLHTSYTLTERHRVQLSFAIPVFYKEKCDTINWIEVFQKHKDTRMLCLFSAMLTFNVPIKYKHSSEIEILKEPMRKIIRKTLGMNENDILEVKFSFDEKEHLTMCFVGPKCFRNISSQIDWYMILAKAEETKHLIRIQQVLIFVNSEENSMKKKQKHTQHVIAAELGMQSIDDVFLEYATFKHDEGTVEVHMFVNVPSFYENEMKNKNWIYILTQHEYTRSLFLQNYSFKFPGVSYKGNKDFTMIKQFAMDISNAPKLEIFIEVFNKPKYCSLSIFIPECFDNSNFQIKIGKQLKRSKYTLFRKIKQRTSPPPVPVSPEIQVNECMPMEWRP